MLWVLLLCLVSLRGTNGACNATIDLFTSTALNQGLQTTIGSFQGSFGEQVVSALKPSVHIRARGAITSNIEVFSYGAGTCTANEVFRCQTGGTAYGYGVLRSVYPLVYHPGESVVGKFTLAIPTPCYEGDCLLAGGLFTTTDGLLIGIRNGVFSVGYQHHGQVEIRTLTVSTAATSGASVTVTVSGTAVVIPITVASTSVNAAEIAAGLTAANLARGYYFEQVANTVIATGKSTDETVGSFAYAAGSTGSAAAWTTQATATPKLEQWIGRSSMQGAADIAFLNETSFNIYQIVFGYLGVANIQYMVMDPTTGKFVTMHVIRPANQDTSVSLRNPSMKIGWIAYRPTLGSANYQVIGGSAQTSRLEFFDEFALDTWGANAEIASVTAASQKYALSLRNQRTLNGYIINGIVRIELLSAITDSTKGAIVRVLRNCQITGTPNWQYTSSTESIVTYDTSATGCTGGELVLTALVGGVGSVLVDASNVYLDIPTGETLTMTVQVISGAASEVDVAVTWTEDF